MRLYIMGMSGLSKALRERRSVRKYLDRPVPEELIREVLSAAGWAPSAHNSQPWRFVVLVDSEVKRRLAEAMAETWVADMAKINAAVDSGKFKLRVERFASSPVLILACITTKDMVQQPDEESQSIERDLAMQSLAAAIENMLLAAHDLGLGACWFCAPAFAKKTVRQVLGVPEKVEPQALIAIGYPDEKPAAPPRKSSAEYCFRNRWGNKFR